MGPAGTLVTKIGPDEGRRKLGPEGDCNAPGRVPRNNQVSLLVRPASSRSPRSPNQGAATTCPTITTAAKLAIVLAVALAKRLATAIGLLPAPRPFQFHHSMELVSAAVSGSSWHEKTVNALAHCEDLIPIS